MAALADVADERRERGMSRQACGCGSGLPEGECTCPPRTCPTCGSDDREVRGTLAVNPTVIGSTIAPCDDPWHDTPPAESPVSGGGEVEAALRRFGVVAKEREMLAVVSGTPRNIAARILDDDQRVLSTIRATIATAADREGELRAEIERLREPSAELRELVTRAASAVRGYLNYHYVRGSQVEANDAGLHDAVIALDSALGVECKPPWEVVDYSTPLGKRLEEDA
jgi:hypothetical protein